VNITEKETSLLKQADGVISLLYWMGKPAIIREDEIEAIKEFINDHQNIELERTQVNTSDIARIVDGPLYSMDGKVFALKNKTVKVNLPSLGYIMVARMEEESIFARKAIMLQNNSFSTW
jgi:transcription antitermination factor NusG